MQAIITIKEDFTLVSIKEKRLDAANAPSSGSLSLHWLLLVHSVLCWILAWSSSWTVAVWEQWLGS